MCGCMCACVRACVRACERRKLVTVVAIRPVGLIFYMTCISHASYKTADKVERNSNNSWYTAQPHH